MSDSSICIRMVVAGMTIWMSTPEAFYGAAHKTGYSIIMHSDSAFRELLRAIQQHLLDVNKEESAVLRRPCLALSLLPTS